MDWNNIFYNMFLMAYGVGLWELLRLLKKSYENRKKKRNNRGIMMKKRMTLNEAYWQGRIDQIKIQDKIDELKKQ